MEVPEEDEPEAEDAEMLGYTSYNYIQLKCGGKCHEDVESMAANLIACVKTK